MRKICDCEARSIPIPFRSGSDRIRWARQLRIGVVSASVTLVWLLAASLAFAADTARIGLLSYGPCDQGSYQSGEFSVFLKGLEELGYTQHENFSIECRSAGLHYDKLRAAADELVRVPVDVIVTVSQPAGQAAHEATEKIPIVSIVSGDPISAGLARSLAKPGGNFTGVSYYATELTAKQMEIVDGSDPRHQENRCSSQS